MDGSLVIESDDRHRVFGRGRLRSKTFGAGARSQAFAHGLMSDDGAARLCELLISAGMVKVIVRVQDEAHRLIGDPFERGLDLGSQRSELVVNNDDAIVTDGTPDISARPAQHVDAIGDLLSFNLNFAEVLLLGNGR